MTEETSAKERNWLQRMHDVRSVIAYEAGQIRVAAANLKSVGLRSDHLFESAAALREAAEELNKAIGDKLNEDMVRSRDMTDAVFESAIAGAALADRARAAEIDPTKGEA